MSDNNVPVTDLERTQAHRIKELKTQLKTVNRHLRDANRGAESSAYQKFAFLEENSKLRSRAAELEAVAKSAQVQISSLMCENARLRESYCLRLLLPV